MKTYILPLALLFGVGAAWLTSRQGGMTPADFFPEELYEPSFPATEVTALASDLRRSVLFGSGDTEITLRYGERQGSGEDWLVFDRVETIPFQVTAVAAREGGDELFVAGITAKGKSKIEKWSFPIRSGGYHVRWTSGPALSIGTPMPPFSAEQLLQGGTFEVPEQGDYGPPEKSELMEPGVGHIRELVADPEGRYLLALTFPGQALYRIRLLDTPPTAELLFTSAQLPHLTKAKTMQVFQVAGVGRTCVFTEVEGSMDPLGAKRTLLIDANNDAVFESRSTLDASEWQAAGYDDANRWQRHWNLGQVFNW